jgi:hypothetical protein
MDQIVCGWTTYKGNHCKKIISFNNDKIQQIKFCNLHGELIEQYAKVNLNNGDLCETFKEIKVVPRSKKHLKSIMLSIGNDDDMVEVCLAGGCIEKADISNSDYITLNSDSSRFYYYPERGQNKTKDLKVLLVQYCQNGCVVSFNGTKYCEECYKKLKDVPRISLVIS